MEGGDRVGRNLVAVGFGDSDSGADCSEGFGECVAGFGGAEEEEGLAGGFGEEGFGEGFGNVLGGNKIYMQADGLHRFGGGWAYDGDSFGNKGWVAAPVKDLDGISAGEEEPIVTF